VRKRIQCKIPWQCGGERGFDVISVTVSCPDYYSNVVNEIRFLLDDLGLRPTVQKLEDGWGEVRVEENIELIVEEYLRAIDKFKPFNSHHEGYAVIKEELDELWDVIKNKKNYSTLEELREALREEATQVAAMALRFLVDFTENSTPKEAKE